MLKTSPIQTLYGGQFTLSAQRIKPKFFFIFFFILGSEAVTVHELNWQKKGLPSGKEINLVIVLILNRVAKIQQIRIALIFFFYLFLIQLYTYFCFFFKGETENMVELGVIIQQYFFALHHYFCCYVAENGSFCWTIEDQELFKAITVLLAADGQCQKWSFVPQGQ